MENTCEDVFVILINSRTIEILLDTFKTTIEKLKAIIS